MNWREGWPTPEWAGEYLWASFGRADTPIGTDLEAIGRFWVERLDGATPTHHESYVGYRYEVGGVCYYAIFDNFPQIMLDPDGVPWYSHFVELSHPSGRGRSTTSNSEGDPGPVEA